MKPVSSSSRMAVVLSCTAVLGATHASNAADKSAGEVATTPVVAPAAKPIELPETVAIVNGDKISKTELQGAFDNAVRSSGMDASKVPEEQKGEVYHKLLEDMITERLLRAASKDIKVEDSEVTAQIEDIKKKMGDDKAFDTELKNAGLDEAKLRSQIKTGLGETKWIKTQIDGKIDVPDAEVEKFYKENIKQFEQPETVRASHILITVPEDAKPDVLKKKEAEAKAAYDRVKKGEDFAKVADELTEDPSGKGSGGDLNFFPKGAMVPEFDQKAFSMKVGDISEPVKTQFGYHVIKVTDKKAAGTASLPEVKEQLTGYLKNQKQQTAVLDVIDKLRDAAKIENKLPVSKAAAGAADAAMPATIKQSE
jgi:peptidyl-prolyl cis-trans isomerase C